MGFFEDVKVTLLLTRKYGDQISETSLQLPSVQQAADELVGEIITSLGTASTSTDIGTRKLHLESTRADILELKRLARGCRELQRAELGNAELQIRRIEMETEKLEQQTVARRNRAGRDLEKRGSIDEAIAVYEKLVANTVDTPLTYRRLAILYRRLKSPDDEIRVLRAARRNIPKSNRKHHAWFKARLHKIESSAPATKEVPAG